MERRKYGFPDVFGVRMVRSADPGLIREFRVPITRPGKFAVWKARKAADKAARKLVRIGRSADPGLGEKFGTLAGKFTVKVGKVADKVAGKLVRIGRSADPGLGEKFGTMAGKFTTKVGKAVDNVAGKIYFG